MHFSIDLYKGRLFTPAKARTTAGYYMDIEPVEVVGATEITNVQDAIIRAIARGNPTVPTPSREASPPSVILKHAGVRNWASYERHLRAWYVEVSDRAFEITPLRPLPDHGLEEDLERREFLPARLGVNALARRIVELATSSEVGNG